MESDAQSIRGLYQANGFLEAKVDATAIDNYKGKHGDLDIQFNIDEGKQTRVASLTLDGIHAFKQEELLGDVASTPGQPYSDFNVATDRDVILALYFNEGFPNANFTSTADRIPQSTPEREPRTDGSGGPTGSSNELKADEKTKRPPEDSKNLIEQADPVRLTYHIEEGPQTTVRKILYSGQHTYARRRHSAGGRSKTKRSAAPRTSR